jgi:uncharacterized protein with PIN domain
MIAVDTSAVVAIAFGEPERQTFLLFSYALAKVRGLPLLFKGNDFSQTDVASACGAPC